MTPSVRPQVSIVCPAYNEAGNLEVLYRRLVETLDPAGIVWEWIAVDDHSRDETFAIVTRLAASDTRVRGVRLSRNFGSHPATLCGLRRAVGECAIVMASDLQDPPELIPRMVALWREGAQLVATLREERPGETRTTVLFSRVYLWCMRHVAGLTNMTLQTGTYKLLDRRVIDAVALHTESGISVQALVFSMGFRTASLSYVQEPRLHGTSNWTLRKKVGLFLDSLAGHTFLPIRVVTAAGLILAFAGVVYGVSLDGSGTIAVILTLSGSQIFITGALGEYLWRTLEAARKRPQYLIEDATDFPNGPGREVYP